MRIGTRLNRDRHETVWDKDRGSIEDRDENITSTGARPQGTGTRLGVKEGTKFRDRNEMEDRDKRSTFTSTRETKLRDRDRDRDKTN